MALTDELRDLLRTLSGREASVVVSVAEEIAASKAFEAELGALSDTRLRALKDEMVAVQRRWAAMMQTMTGLVARRSRREFGHRGFAAKEGHRSAVTLLQDDLGVSKAEAARVVDAVIDSITRALKKGDTVTLVGFGTFQVRERAARSGRNPKTGETIKIDASKNPAFKAGKALKDAVN